MVNKQIKRLEIIIYVFWTFFGAYLHNIDGFGSRDLFEYISLLLIGISFSFRIKSKLKYIWIFLLSHNVLEELVLIMGNDDILNYFDLIKYPLLIILSVILFRTNINYTKPNLL